MKKTSLLLVSSLMILSFPAFSAEQKAMRPVKDNYISDNANISKYKISKLRKIKKMIPKGSLEKVITKYIINPY